MSPDPRPLADGEDGILLPVAAFRGILEDILRRGESVRFRAGGISMHPFIRDGDVLTVSPLAHGRSRLGDVVAVRQPGADRLLVHRVVAARPGRVVTRGDAAHSDDGPVPGGCVLGVVTRVERGAHEVTAGRGPERRVLALLSRHGLLTPLVAGTRKLAAGWRRLR